MHLILADTLQFCTQRSIWRPLMTTPTFPSRSPFFFYYYFYFLSFLSPSMLLLLLLFFFVVVVIRLFIGPFRDGGEPMALKRWGSTNYSCKSRDVMPWIPIESANICIDGGDWKVEEVAIREMISKTAPNDEIYFSIILKRITIEARSWEKQ